VLADLGVARSLTGVPASPAALAEVRALTTPAERAAWAAAFERGTGDILLLDGHLRAEEIRDQALPVELLDLDEREQAELLATFDPIGDLATMDRGKFIDLAGDFNSTNAAVQALVADLAKVDTGVPDFGLEGDGATGGGEVGYGEDGANAGDELADAGSARAADRFAIFSQEQIIDAAFSWFRSRPFPYRDLPLHVQYQEINRLAVCKEPLGSRDGYQVADTYNKHRFHGHARGMGSPIDAFEDDTKLRKALRLDIENGGIGDGLPRHLTIVNGTQACSNFRPGYAMHMYHRFGVRGGITLDPSTGYGGRLVGWIASRIGGRYVGVDPSTKTHDGNSRLAAAIAPCGSVTLIHQPFEDVDWGSRGLLGAVDFAFTSPPYFAKEEYAEEETQSFKRYPTADAWRSGFLRPLMRGLFALLAPSRYAVINIADVRIDGAVVPLGRWTVEEGEGAGFVLKETTRFDMAARMCADMGDVASEPVFVFYKGNAKDLAA
jgi:hypothetical protein